MVVLLEDLSSIGRNAFLVATKTRLLDDRSSAGRRNAFGDLRLGNVRFGEVCEQSSVECC